MPSPGQLYRLLPYGLAASLAILLLYPLKRRQAGKQPHLDNAAIISIDTEQVILHANDAAAQLFGSKPDAMQGMPLSHFILRDLRGFSIPDNNTPGNDLLSDISQDLRLTGRRATDVSLTGKRADGVMFALEGSLSSTQQGEHSMYTFIVRDISAHKQVHTQLARSFSQLRELSNALQTIREEERRHIARELHDDLGQLLATLRVDLTLVQQHGDMTAPLHKLALNMDGLLVTAISSLRRIAGNLRPRALDEGGLYFALQKLRQDFLLRQNVQFDLLADEADLVLDDAHSTAIYRIVQEALTNIARHAEASHITIVLHRLDSSLAIAIQDDGKGIADRDLKKAASLGLLGMRERVWGLNGDIQLGTDSDLGGTRIDILLPIYTAATASP